MTPTPCECGHTGLTEPDQWGYHAPDCPWKWYLKGRWDQYREAIDWEEV